MKFIYTMKRILIYIAICFLSTAYIFANDARISSVNKNISKTMADSAYQKNDYQLAIEMYETILKQKGVSAAIYYNLGNSYYKSDKIAKAIINYERALLLNPDDKDIRFNLDMAKSKTIDKINPTREVFYITWIKSLAYEYSVDKWAIVGIFSFIISLASFILYFMAKRICLKKVGFFSSLIFLAITICSNTFAFNSRDSQINRTGAIIVVPNVSIKSTPNGSGTDLFILHEGTKVIIKDNSMNNWKEIQVEDGNVGWIETKNIEII